jgi:hypothetical protein
MDKVWVGDNLLTFDGAVLELFGHPASPSARFHVELLELDVGEPDRKDRRPLTLKPSTRFGGGIQIHIPPEDWPQAEPFLDRVLAAMPD